jgi:lipopolysaccharide transport system ATP-binding protein
MSGEAVLNLHNVGFCFLKRSGYLSRKAFWALKDVSFQVHRGESLGVVGRNGAGKTTMLKLMAGILEPDRGRVENRGASTSLLSLQAGFIPYLSGRENAILNGMYLGMKKLDIVARLDAIREFAELGDFFDEPIYSYSAGMRARLGFATALQIDPDILLIDEVHSVGDAAFQKKSLDAMREKIRSDKTIVFVSHGPGAVKSLCDRVVWIENGRVAMESGPDAVLDAYGQTIAPAG